MTLAGMERLVLEVLCVTTPASPAAIARRMHRIPFGERVPTTRAREVRTVLGELDRKNMARAQRGGPWIPTAIGRELVGRS